MKLLFVLAAHLKCRVSPIDDRESDKGGKCQIISVGGFGVTFFPRSSDHEWPVVVRTMSACLTRREKVGSTAAG